MNARNVPLVRMVGLLVTVEQCRVTSYRRKGKIEMFNEKFALFFDMKIGEERRIPSIIPLCIMDSSLFSSEHYGLDILFLCASWTRLDICFPSSCTSVHTRLDICFLALVLQCILDSTLVFHALVPQS